MLVDCWLIGEAARAPVWMVFASPGHLNGQDTLSDHARTGANQYVPVEVFSEIVVYNLSLVVYRC
jgi:hypothetical protein